MRRQLRVGGGPHLASGTMRGVGEALTLDEHKSRLAALTDDRAVWMALACAERLLARASADQQAVLRDALSSAWEALAAADRTRAAALAAVLEERDDLDDDPVASVYFALEAVAGTPDAAGWGAARGIDDAFERVPYPDGATEFRPLVEDAATETVQQELRWQMLAADTVSQAATADEVRAWVQQRPERSSDG
jgi:hypothetical protein